MTGMTFIRSILSFSIHKLVSLCMPRKVEQRSEKHPLYCCWRMMKSRCSDKKSDSYGSYGGRGISVCSQWRESFWKFCEDMGPRPSPKHTVDRINNNGNYEPGNCQWATQERQCRNRRDNRWVSAFGCFALVLEWADCTKIPRALIIRRLDRGWPPEDAVSKPSPSGVAYAWR